MGSLPLTLAGLLVERVIYKVNSFQFTRSARLVLALQSYFSPRKITLRYAFKCVCAGRRATTREGRNGGRNGEMVNHFIFGYGQSEASRGPKKRFLTPFPPDTIFPPFSPGSCEKFPGTTKASRAETQRRGGDKRNKAVIHFESLRLCVSARDCQFLHRFLSRVPVPAAMGRPFGSARPRVLVHRWTCRASMRVSPGKKFWIWCARVVARPVGS